MPDPARLTDQQIENAEEWAERIGDPRGHLSGLIAALRAERATSERLRERLAAYENLRAEVVYAIQRGYGSTSGVKETLAALDRLDQEKP